MATFTVASGFNAVLLHEVVNVLLIERTAEAAAMRRLGPLRMCVAMAASAICGRYEFVCAYKRASRGLNFSRGEGVWAKWEIIILLFFFGFLLTLGFIGSGDRITKREYDEGDEGS